MLLQIRILLTEPTANDDTATVQEDSSVTVPVLINDLFGGDWSIPCPIFVATSPSNGTALVNNGGTPNNPLDDTIVYTPNHDFHGTDSFTYTILDADGQPATATVTITVTPDNPIFDTPTANNDVASTLEDTPVLIPVLVNDLFGGDGPSATAIVVATQPANGVVTLNDGGTPNYPVDDTFTYTPNLNFHGTDVFTYTIADSDGQTSTATVTVTVISDPTGDVPSAVNDTRTTDEDVAISIDVLTNDDFGGDGHSTGAIIVATQPANGTAVLNNNGTPNNPADDTILYTPNPNYFGNDSFTYTITDADGQTSTATVTITVNPINDLPVAVDDPNTVIAEDSAGVTIAVLANDNFNGDEHFNNCSCVNCCSGSQRNCDCKYKRYAITS
ncbi:Ig-like domain-containing protein [Flavobacterium sp. 3HN19-14]|uniref:Ig-like domain-containing protein n=1 Tax=Flavobacterium sp. 3HN19-14 TaxID=3448133 RepID=UPI003EE41777